MIIPELESAAKLFAGELNGHLLFFRELLSDLQSGQGIKRCRDETKSIAQRFHTLKGGAGFLGLIQIHQAVAEGEAFFKNLSIGENDREKIEARLCNLLSVLDQESKSLNQYLRQRQQQL